MQDLGKRTTTAMQQVRLDGLVATPLYRPYVVQTRVLFLWHMELRI